jgi:hypothetical protein
MTTTGAWKPPGRKEISQWLDGWIDRYRSLGDPFAVSREHLFTIVCSNLGWYWDIDDVGRAPSPGYEPNGSPISGFYKFLDETMAAKKRKRAAESHAHR